MKRKALIFQDCFKTFTRDQDKAVTPEDTLARFYSQIEKLDVQILSEVNRIDNGRLDIPVYFSVCADGARGVTGTKKQMGKGASPIQAQASACMELAERFSFFAHKSDPANFLTGDYPQMRKAGYPVMPLELLLDSVHDTTTSTGALELLLADIPMQWAWATNVTTGEEALVPFSWFYAINEFNGPSAGNTIEEAALQGVCEIVERHVCSLISHQMIETPLIDPGSVKDAVAAELLAKFARHNIEVYLSDFSLDTGIPTVGALAIDRSTFPGKSEIVYTAGTTTNPEKALIRAVTEVAQLAGDFNTGSNYVASGLPKPLSMEEVAYITDTQKCTSIQQMEDVSDDNIRVELELCIAALKKKGMQVFMIDVTHPQLDIPALYTIIPGAHFRERSLIKDAGLFAAKLLSELVDDNVLLEKKLEQMESLLPDAYYLEFYRGKNFVNMGFPESAIPHFDRSLEKGPEAEDLPYIYSYKGYCLKEMGRFDEAIEVLALGAKEDDERPDIHNMLGVCHFKKDNYEQAVFHFKRAVELNPASGIDYANLGINYSRLGKTDEAIHYFTIGLTLDPGLDFARKELSILLGSQEKENGK